MNNELILQTKKDIPFVEAQVNIHQPTISEISIITEESFLNACQIIDYNRNLLKEETRNAIANQSDFDILMSILNEKEYSKQRNYVLMLFALLFPEYQIKITPVDIVLLGNNKISRINRDNYEVFKDIVVSMFDLGQAFNSKNAYNPVGKRAEKIAEKLKNRKVNKKEEDKKKSVFSYFISVLSVGLQKDKNELAEYTVYQLKDEFIRFQKKQSFDFYIEAKKAGAQDLEEVDNWME